MAHSDILSQPDRGLGLDRPQTEALLALFSRCDDLREFGREVIQSVVNALMDSQAQELRRAPRLQVARARQQQERLPREVPVDLPRRPRAAGPQAARGDLLPRGHTRALHARRGVHGRARARDVRRRREHPQGRARRRGARRLLAVQLRGVGAVRRAGRGGRGVQDPGRSRASTPTCGSTRPT